MTSNDDNAADQPATTVIPPDLAPTQARAYSAIEDYDDPEQGDTQLASSWAPPASSWGVVWGSAGILLACGLVAALVIGVMVWVAMRKRADDAQAGPAWSPPAESTSAVTLPPPTQTSTTPPPPTVTYTATATPRPPTTTTVTVTPPAPVAAPSEADLDERYLSDLTSAGLRITNVREVIRDAHQICAYLAAGHSEADAARLAMRDNTTLTEGNAETLIGSAVQVYCPQF
jgi:hypothetical protein